MVVQELKGWHAFGFGVAPATMIGATAVIINSDFTVQGMDSPDLFKLNGYNQESIVPYNNPVRSPTTPPPAVECCSVLATHIYGSRAATHVLIRLLHAAHAG